MRRSKIAVKIIINTCVNVLLIWNQQVLMAHIYLISAFLNHTFICGDV